MRCPACGAENPERTWQCVCGHYFVSEPVRPPAPVASPEPPPARASGSLSFHGKGETLFEIYIVNLLLTFLTLGFYYFWGKVKVRKYLYSQAEFAADRFEYHGTGKELLVGWLKAMLCILGLFGILAILQNAAATDMAEIGSRIITLAAYVTFIPVAIVGSRRYRLSRSSWRAIRFSFRGHTKELIGIFLRDGLFLFLTFGLYYPYFLNHVREFLVANSYFGTRPFDYDGKGADLWRIYFVGVLLTVFTLGIYYFWYSAGKQRFYWQHTTFGAARFRFPITGWELLKLKALNLLLVVFTFGLALPWVWVRNARFALTNLKIEGPVDLEAIQQEALAASATGEGLTDLMDASFLDVDLGF